MKKNIVSTILSVILVSFLSMSCSKSSEDADENAGKSEEITLEGKYVGTWNSNTDMNITYTDFGISAILKFSNSQKTQLSGEFFATQGFGSCCNSGANDGTLIIRLEGNKVTLFSYKDIIPNCEGSFGGTGSITSENPFTLEIDFEGGDCDGNHIGKMVFKRKSGL